jgi:hypothetical protein
VQKPLKVSLAPADTREVSEEQTHSPAEDTPADVAGSPTPYAPVIAGVERPCDWCRETYVPSEGGWRTQLCMHCYVASIA